MWGVSYWKFSDGTTVYSHADVVGPSPFAAHLRRELLCLAYGCGPLVWLPTQGHAVELDTTDDFLLAQWLEQEARLYKIQLVETDFHTTHPLLSPAEENGDHHGRVATD